MAGEENNTQASQIANAAAEASAAAGKAALRKIAYALPGVGKVAAEALIRLGGKTIDRAARAIADQWKNLRDFAGGLLLVSGYIIGAMMSAILAALTLPLIIVFIGLPLFIALTLVIINNSAWVVPPGNTISQENQIIDVDSPFIEVTKTATPFNSPDPTTVTYTITILAERSTLSNVTYTYDCFATNNSGVNPCPTTPDVEQIAVTECGDTITALNSCTFTYDVVYGVSFDDSIVTDTILVTADAEGVPNEQSSAHASVIFGNPPVNCPLLGGSIAWLSYTPGNEVDGHGSNNYWSSENGVGPPACRYVLPVGDPACNGPNQASASTNVCHNQAQTCSHYGYAIDVWPGSTLDVTLPSIESSWNYVRSFASGGGSTGYGHIYEGSSYTVVLLHVNQNAVQGNNIPAGTVIGQLFPQGNNTHLHIELLQNGTYIKPESLLCLGTFTPPPPPNLNGWYIRANISANNIVASRQPDEINQKTCSWVNSKGLRYGVNANFFDDPYTANKWAGYDGSFSNYPTQNTSTFRSFVVYNNGQGAIVNTNSITNTDNIKSIVTGVAYSSQAQGSRARTMLGINGNTLYLLALQSATPLEAQAAIQSLNISDGFALDGGGSTTLCDSGNPLIGNTRFIPVSIGVRSGELLNFAN